MASISHLYRLLRQRALGATISTEDEVLSEEDIGWYC